MAYKNWKIIDKVGVAIDNERSEWRGKKQFSGYIFEEGDSNSREKAVEWARSYENRWDKDKETIVHEPQVHIFDNEGFTVTILDSAGGSSQGGRLSFWKCEVEKDGVKFIVGVNDAILADLIRNSDIKQGTVQQKVMFVRKGGQPGFIHKDMEAYQEATADMKHKAEMKKAKKTTKWELGGVYQTITQTSICIGEVWDVMEEYEANSSSWPYRLRTELRDREEPVKVLAWINYYEKDDMPETLEEVLKSKLESTYYYFSAGKPPARAKTKQLEVKESDQKLLNKFIKNSSYNGGRYSRKIK